MFSEKRIYHTISIFFWGLVLYYNISVLKKRSDQYIEKIDKRIITVTKIPRDKLDSTNFIYYWFLICFFHDLAYFIEEDNEKNIKFFGVEGNTKIKDKVLEVLNQNLLKDRKDTTIVPKLLIDNCGKYLKYRYEFKHTEKLDHGILGETYFYYSIEEKLHHLNDLYEKNYKNDKNIEYFSGLECRDKSKNLLWSKYILNEIQYDISMLICSHNIYFGKNGESNVKYEEYNIKDLVIDKPIYNYSDYPLYFLMVLVDTIDV